MHSLVAVANTSDILFTTCDTALPGIRGHGPCSGVFAERSGQERICSSWGFGGRISISMLGVKLRIQTGHGDSALFHQLSM